MVKAWLPVFIAGMMVELVRVGLDEVLRPGVRQPFELLMGAVLGIGEQRVEIRVEELRAAAIGLCYKASEVR